MDGMSMGVHAGGRRERGREMEEVAVVEEGVGHCEGWEDMMG